MVSGEFQFLAAATGRGRHSRGPIRWQPVIAQHLDITFEKKLGFEKDLFKQQDEETICSCHGNRNDKLVIIHGRRVRDGCPLDWR